MNKGLVLVFLMLLFNGSIQAQTNNTKTPPKQNIQKTVVSKPSAPASVLKNLRDSASYAGGLFIINVYKNQGVSNFNSSLIKRAINELQAGKPSLISTADADKVVLAYQVKLRNKTVSKPPVAKPGVIFKDLRDSASYAAGIFLYTIYKSYDITNLNSDIVAKAVNDRQTGKATLLNDNAANKAVMDYQYKLQLEISKTTIEAGENFLAENKKREGVITTPSGLQYEVVTQGTGPLPTLNDMVSCNYKGTFIDGIEFDNSYKTGRPVVFKVTGVITGWTEALQLMPVGSKWKLYIPYQLGYGPGKYNDIPGGSVLLFELELVGIQGK